MSVFIDTHAHFYPSYDPERFLAAFRRRTERTWARVGALFAADREGQDSLAVFEPLASRTEDAALLLPGMEGEPDVVIAAARQIACAERVEILALGTRKAFRDGMPAADAVRAALDADALPVLAWGVGKWLGARAKVVEALLRRFRSDELFLGDTSLRPVFWPTPAPMIRAPTFGRRVLHGSDPLPPRREETRAGQWADLAEEPFDERKPLLRQLLAILREGVRRPVGRRAGPFQFFVRQFLK